MKVGIVVPYSFSFWGGVVERAEGQAHALAALGVDVRILTRAFAAGIPVVASDIDGSRGVVSERRGRLVPPGDAAAVYGWGAIAARLRSIYASLVEAPTLQARARRVLAG